VCRNPDVKCSVIERAIRNMRERLYKYFTYKNTYRYIDVITKCVERYNGTVHTTTGMAPPNVRDTDILTIWKNKTHRLGRMAAPKFHLDQHMRIGKEKMKFSKGGEQNFTTDIFMINKVIRRSPSSIYEIEDLRGQHITDQFCMEELTPVIITKKTTYKIDNT
jgi:hypothetical protein